MENVPEVKNRLANEDEEPRQYVLFGTATADTVQYNEDITKHIIFRKTKMFTQRVYKFNLENTSKIQMKFYCKIVSSHTGIQDKGFYEISPPYGEIDAGLS